jgi:hypothetical protein
MGPRGPHGGEHHNDRPPRFQKMDFPKFDGKSNPLAFINRCESYFHQQRTAEEEKVWMASYNLEAGAQLWFMQIQRDEGTPSWRCSTKLLNTRFGPPLRSNPLSELVVCRRTARLSSTRTGLRPCFLASAHSQRPRKCSSSPPAYNRPSASTLRSTTPVPCRRHESHPQAGTARSVHGGLHATTSPPAPARSPTGAPAVTRSTCAQSADCFNCNEKFGRGHNRVCQRIFLLDLALKDDEGTPGWTSRRSRST